jgi:hypothetical protein
MPSGAVWLSGHDVRIPPEEASAVDVVDPSARRVIEVSPMAVVGLQITSSTVVPELLAIFREIKFEVHSVPTPVTLT